MLDRLIPVEHEVQDRRGRWYLTRIHPYRSTSDRIEGVVVTFVDISRRRASEESLRESEEQFRALVTASAQTVWTTDREGLVVEDSPSWRAFTGQSFEEWAGRGWLGALHPDDRADADAVWQQSVETGTPLDIDFRLYHAPSETYHWMNARAVPLLDAEGTIRGWVGMNTDIDGRKRSEETLREARDLLRMATEASQLGWGTWDLRTGTTRWDERGREMMGLSKAENTTTVWLDRIHPEDRPRVEAHIERCVAEGNPFSMEYRIVRPDGTVCHIHGTGMFESAPDGSSTRGIGLVRDITEQKAAEAALAALMETLEERVRERTEQVRDLASRLTIAEQEERARIAHILHDDLQQVIVAAQMGLASIRQGVPNPQEVSEDVHDILERAIDITRTLSHELSPPLLKGEDLNDLLKWIVERKRTLYGMEVDLDIKGSVHVPDPALCVLLYRLLREPLFNVVKHAGTLRARIIAEETDGHVRIVVVDKGAGFDPALLSEHRSEGFGLQSVRERLSLIGGRFEVASEPGEGTRVTLSVPLRPQKA